MEGTEAICGAFGADQEEAQDRDTRAKQHNRRMLAIIVGMVFLITLFVTLSNAIAIYGARVPTYDLELPHSLPQGEDAEYSVALKWNKPDIPTGGEVIRPVVKFEPALQNSTQAKADLSAMRIHPGDKVRLVIDIPTGTTPIRHVGRITLNRESGAEDLPKYFSTNVSIEVTPWWRHWRSTLYWIGLLLACYLFSHVVCELRDPSPSGWILFEDRGSESVLGNIRVRKNSIELHRSVISVLFPWRKSYVPLVEIARLAGIKGVGGYSELFFAFPGIPPYLITQRNGRNEVRWCQGGVDRDNFDGMTGVSMRKRMGEGESFAVCPDSSGKPILFRFSKSRPIGRV